MGYWKEKQLEEDERIYNSPDTFACLTCITEPHLASHVEAAVEDEPCSYCDAERAHHRAYDTGFLSVTPEYKVSINGLRLEASGSAATQAILESFDGQSVHLPNNKNLWPNPTFLESRCG